MTDPLKILVIRLSSLGDILHALPAFAGLRAAFPDAKIDWLVGKSAGFLLSAVPGINTVHTFDKTALFQPTLRSPLWRLIRKLRAEHYDFSIDFQGLLKTAFLGCMSGANIRIGFPKNMARETPAHWFYNRMPCKPEQTLHVIEMNRLLAGCIGAEIVKTELELVVDDKDARYIESLIEKNGLNKFVVLNPGGGWPSKTWKPEYFGQLADKIQRELNHQVVVTTGPGEESLYEAISAHCRATLPIHIQISFLQLIPLLRKARLLIGGDTGPFHLACALNTAVVGIYGPTCPVRNGPWGKNDEVVVHALPCSLCYKRECPTDNACMDIGVDEVFAAVTRRMEKPI